MQLTTKKGLKIQLPSPEEDTAINAGIAADPDTYELSDSEFKQLRSVGRPKAEATKQRITSPITRGSNSIPSYWTWLADTYE